MHLWFTSDTHFNHANIIQYCKRPFIHVDEMDEFLIQQWNAYVKPSDHIYHLGDLCMCRPKQLMRIWCRLNGHKRLIRGNHDIYKTKEYIQEAGFEEIYGIRVLDDIIFTHIPIHPGSLGRFKANVHGHIHNNESYPAEERVEAVTQKVRMVPYVNICVEVTNYHPVDLEWIKGKIQETQ